MRPKLAGTGFDEIAGPTEQHRAAALGGVCCRSLGMQHDPEFAQTVKAAASWPDVDIKCDNTRGLAGGNGWNSTRPPCPPLLEDGPVGGRIEVAVAGEWKFPVPACGPW